MAAFVRVDPASFAADDALARWLQRGLEFISRPPAEASQQPLTQARLPGPSPPPAQAAC